MNRDENINLIKKFALKHSEMNDIHGFYHTERVLKLCMKIGEELNANLHILEISALLHDIGRTLELDDHAKRNHADISAQMALEFLTSNDLGIYNKDIENIIHCIKSHSYSNNVHPSTLEAKILYDADKLDAIGAIGLYRTIAFTTQNNGGIAQIINHLEEKILKIYNLLVLDISKSIALKRREIVLIFYNQLLDELK